MQNCTGKFSASNARVWVWWVQKNLSCRFVWTRRGFTLPSHNGQGLRTFFFGLLPRSRNRIHTQCKSMRQRLPQPYRRKTSMPKTRALYFGNPRLPTPSFTFLSAVASCYLLLHAGVYTAHIWLCLHFKQYIMIPVVPHKAVAEVSKIGNL